MNSRQDDLDAAVAAADPYPQAQVDDLAVDEAGRDLMETIMTSTQPARRAGLTDHQTTTDHRRGRFLTPLLAAAAVTAVVAGGLALRGVGEEPTPPEAAPAAGPSSAPGASTPSDPGLAPTGANLHHVVGGEDWQVGYVDDSASGGELAWEAPGLEMEMHWYRAEDYQGYLADREEIGPEEEVELLRQTGKAFTYDAQQPEVNGEKGVPLQKKPAVSGEPSATTDGDEPDGTRVMVLLPPVDGWFLEFDVHAQDRTGVDAALAQLSRVSPDAWQASLGDDVVLPAEADAFLAEVAQDVPVPDGVEVTAEDLHLPQSPYQARIAFLSPVLCGWAEEYVNGNDAAIDVLRGSKDWPAVKALSPEGEYGSVLADVVRKFAKDRDLKSFRQGLC